MVVLVEEIGVGGLDVNEEFGVDRLEQLLTDEAQDSGVHAAGPARFVAHLEKVSDKILVKGKTTLALKGDCKRCLAETTQSVLVEFMLGLVREPKKADPGSEHEPKVTRDEEGTAASFDLVSAEEETYNGREIDLDPIFREQILLALPMGLLCREDCKGLCTVCGADLNEAECGCDRKPADPRWAALKNIKLN